MDKIRVNRATLLETLKRNQEEHKKQYEEAMEVWVKKSKKALRRAARLAEESGEITQFPLEDLPKPQSYNKSYTDAIMRVEFDVRDEIELDDREFAAWVQDDWVWQGQFIANSTRYIG